MRMLIISSTVATNTSAYQHRLNYLASSLRDAGVDTEMLYLGNSSLLGRHSFTCQLRVLWMNLPWGQYDYFLTTGALFGILHHLRRRKGTQVVYDCQGLRYSEIDLNNPPGRWWKAPLMHRLEKTAIRQCDLAITVSVPQLRHLEEWRGGPKGLTIIRNGVDADAFAPSERRSRQDGVFRVGYAGGFQSWQAVDLLIAAAKELRNRRDIAWRIIGFSATDQSLKRQLAADLPEGAELIDRCDRGTLTRLLGECDLLAIPRRPYLACQVALPTKFAEFAAMAKPVLVNTVDETADITRQCNCGFVAESNGSSMADAISKAAATDADTLHAMGLSGRRYVVQEMSWPVIGRRFREFLEANRK